MSTLMWRTHQPISWLVAMTWTKQEQGQGDLIQAAGRNTEATVQAIVVVVPIHGSMFVDMTLLAVKVVCLRYLAVRSGDWLSGTSGDGRRKGGRLKHQQSPCSVSDFEVRLVVSGAEDSALHYIALHFTWEDFFTFYFPLFLC